MANTVGMISLGCPKNQVDAERMLALLKNSGFIITPEEDKAEVIIVNTCGFIEQAKAEAIENIIEAAGYKKIGKLKVLIVTGCLAERYRDEIKKEMPEVDVVVGIGSNSDIVEIVKNALKGKAQNRYDDKELLELAGHRLLTTPPYTAYIKIAEGCDNHCTYCAIPSIRGRFRSRTIEDVVSEAKELAKCGVKELVVVAQDTTMYGADIYGKPMLAKLLKSLCEIDGLHWIRTLYTYPDRIDDELLYTIRDNEKLVKYLDIPIQHCNSTVLKRMNRKGSREQLVSLIEKIRSIIPGVTIRTSLITGFPGENEEQFGELCEFVNYVKFDRLGCFAYSPEEGTPAAGYTDQIDEQTKNDRMEIIMNDQLTIIAQKNQQKIGQRLEVLVEGYDDYIRCYYGRSAADAPDIDGKVFFSSIERLRPGQFVFVKINDVIDYDLLGEMVR